MAALGQKVENVERTQRQLDLFMIVPLLPSLNPKC